MIQWFVLFIFFSSFRGCWFEFEFEFFLSLIYNIFIIIAMIFNIIYYYIFRKNNFVKIFIIIIKIIYDTFYWAIILIIILIIGIFSNFLILNFPINSYNFFNQNFFFFNTLANMPFHWENNSSFSIYSFIDYYRKYKILDNKI